MSNVPPSGEPRAWPDHPQDQPPATYTDPGGYGAPAPPQPKNGVGIAALVVGIVALVLSWIPFLGLLLAIIGLGLGIAGIRKASRREATNKGMAIAGAVTSGLALLLAGFITVVVVDFFGSEEVQDFADCIEAAQTAEEQQACQTQFEEDLNQ